MSFPSRRLKELYGTAAKPARGVLDLSRGDAGQTHRKSDPGDRTRAQSACRKSLGGKTRSEAAKDLRLHSECSGRYHALSKGHEEVDEIVHSVEETAVLTFKTMQNLRIPFEVIAQDAAEAGTPTQSVDANGTTTSGAAELGAEAAGSREGLASWVSDRARSGNGALSNFWSWCKRRVQSPTGP